MTDNRKRLAALAISQIHNYHSKLYSEEMCTDSFLELVDMFESITGHDSEYECARLIGDIRGEQILDNDEDLEDIIDTLKELKEYKNRFRAREEYTLYKVTAKGREEYGTIFTGNIRIQDDKEEDTICFLVYRSTGWGTLEPVLSKEGRIWHYATAEKINTGSGEREALRFQIGRSNFYAESGRIS